MAIKTPWSYYYQAKDALQMIEAFFVFGNKDDLVYNDFDRIYSGLKHIGEVLSNEKDGDN